MKYNDVIIEDIDAADEYYKKHQQNMQSDEIQDYLNFIYNPDNYMRCKGCPENQSFSEYHGYRLPCGQFHCWVGLHNAERRSTECSG